MILSSAYSFSKDNVQGIEGPSPFWRYGAAVLKKMLETGKSEGFDFRTNLNQFATKALFLYSSNNNAYTDAFAQKVAAAYPNVQLSKVQGTGHEMIYFKWDAVYTLALPYLQSLR